MTVVLVILILAALIVVHELGHFIAAKLSGVRVQEFGVGYPPVALTLGRIGETLYTLNWLPLGGFVRLFGDEGESERGRGSFVEAPRWRQALILLAGVAMNALAAYAFFAAAYALGIPRAVETPGAAASPASGIHLFIADVVAGSPAAAAGIRARDTLLALRDAAGAQPASLSPQAVEDFVSARGGKRLEATLLRGAGTISAEFTPANAVIPGAPGRAGAGIDLVLVTSSPAPLSEASGLALRASEGAFVSVFQNVWNIIRTAFSGSLDLTTLVGPVGLVSVVGQAETAGLAQVLALAGFISINLAVINLLPIPLLDGGRLVLVAVEAVARRPAPKLAVHALNLLGLALIASLMLVVTYHDIARLVA